MADISRAQVLHVASLARLALDEPELDRMAGELGAILDYMDRLNELDAQGVEPTAQVGLEALPMRSDDPRESLDHDVVLAQSPQSGHDGFMVPGFVED